MSKKVTHIIHKLNLDIDVPDERLARSMYQRAGSILQEYVLPQLEMLLKQYEEDGLHIRLDKLDIHLNAGRTASFEEMIKVQLAEAIAKELEHVIQAEEGGEGQDNKPVKRPANEHERITEAFLWFLEQGTLPWWVSDNGAFAGSREIIDAITHTEETFIPLFVKKLQASPVMQMRLLLQFDGVLLTYLFSLVIPLELFTIATRYEQRIAELWKEQFEGNERQWYWAQVWALYPLRELLSVSSGALEKKLDQLLSDKVIESETAQRSPDFLTETIATELSALNYKSSPGKEEPGLKDQTDNPETKLPEVEDGLIGSNAGLVLLHPFLQYFFKELGLLEYEKFLNTASRDIAVHLLHYLATGKEHAADFDLVFEKYLCGMYVSQATYRFVTLSERMKSEADTLLQSVIKHWSVLKNTSTEGLREGFLQRKGKLVLTGNSSMIIMEQNTLDILLQQVPWNISLLKLPWMDHLIHVEWMNPV